ncbi:MAG: porin, partial [Planctomycetales bacterium]|nr:porin [Planctomycetales bacterium]
RNTRPTPRPENSDAGDRGCCDRVLSPCDCDSRGCDSHGCVPCGCASCGCGVCGAAADEPWRLLPQDVGGWKFYGWAAQGITANSRSPVNPPVGFGNLPTTFNYRHGQYQLNQLYGVLEREADNGGCGWALGGRVDLLYGEDYIFTTAAGLEARPDGTQRWNEPMGGNGQGINGSSRLGLAMPQVYADVAYSDLHVKIGHFYTIIGYEVVTATGNFFYSHAYTMQYGEPFTHTGALATWEMNDAWTVYGGAVNGWDKFDAVIDRFSFLGGLTWSSCDERTSFTATVITGDEDGTTGAITGNRTMYSLVLSHQFADRLQYVLQHDLGHQANGVAAGQAAEWYGINQYLFYTVNDCWKLGMRGEWFNDQNGTRVTNFGGHYYEITAGLNWTPTNNIALRPEVRWDWYDPHAANTPPGPYDNFTERSQFTAAVDLILQF